MSQCLTPLFTDRRRADEQPGWSYLFGSIELYHNIMLAGIFTWGVLAALGADPPAQIFHTLPPAVYAAWAFCYIAAPPTAWLGLFISRGKRGRDKRIRRAKWQLQAAGDSAVTIMLITTGIAYAYAAEHYLTLLLLMLATFPLGLTIRDFDKSRRLAADAE